MFGLNEKCYIWRKANTEFWHKDLIPSVKCGDGSTQIWAHFVVSGSGQFVVTDGNMNSELQQQENVRISISELKFKRKSIMKQDSSPNVRKLYNQKMVKAEKG